MTHLFGLLEGVVDEATADTLSLLGGVDAYWAKGDGGEDWSILEGDFGAGVHDVPYNFAVNFCNE